MLCPGFAHSVPGFALNTGKRSTEMKRNTINDKREWYRTEYLKSDHWKSLKARKLVQNPNCSGCWSNAHLDVHHIRYRNLYDVDLSDLLTLCRACHIKEHERLRAKKKEWKKHKRRRPWPHQRVHKGPCSGNKKLQQLRRQILINHGLNPDIKAVPAWKP